MSKSTTNQLKSFAVVKISSKSTQLARELKAILEASYPNTVLYRATATRQFVKKQSQATLYLKIERGTQ